MNLKLRISLHLDSWEEDETDTSMIIRVCFHVKTSMGFFSYYVQV